MSRTHTVPTGTIQPSTTYKDFDLPDFVQSLPSAWLRAEAARGYAWRIDTMIVQACRTLFRTLRDTCTTGNLDDASDYNLALAEQAFAEETFEEAGSITAGPVRTLHELLDLRPEAHSIARDCIRLVLDWKGHLQSYETPEISDLLKNQGTMKPKASTIARIERSAKRSAARVATGKDVEILAARLAEKKIAHEQMNSAAMSRALKAQTGALEQMFRIALDRRPEKMMDRTLAFHQIDIETQRTLIMATIDTIQRADERAARDSSLSESEYDDVSLSVELSADELKKVLRSPRFNNGVDDNNTASHKVLTTPLVTTKVKVTTGSTERKLPKPKAAPKPKKLQIKAEPKPVAPPAAPAVTTANSMSDIKSLIDQPNDLS